MQIIDGFISYGEENGVEVGDIADAMDAETDAFDPANAAKAADELLTVFDANPTATYLVEDERHWQLTRQSLHMQICRAQLIHTSLMVVKSQILQIMAYLFLLSRILYQRDLRKQIAQIGYRD